MPRSLRFLVSACLLLLPGCQTQTQPTSLGGSLFVSNTAALLPAGNVHLVTYRDRDGHAIFCSEPSPDWAIAFGNSLTGALSASLNGAGNGSVSGTEATTQAITALVGRSAGVVALRDGLYAACQAYANGIIGKDAYALVLSQYGNLLVSLAASGSSSSSSGGGSSTPATPAGVAVAVSTGAAPASPPSSPSSGASNGDATRANKQLELLQGLFVACLTENDPTTRTGPDRAGLASSNPLLSSTGDCTAVIHAVAAATQDLLTPPTTTQAKPPPPAARPSPPARKRPPPPAPT